MPVSYTVCNGENDYTEYSLNLFHLSYRTYSIYKLLENSFCLNLYGILSLLLILIRYTNDDDDEMYSTVTVCITIGKLSTCYPVLTVTGKKQLYKVHLYYTPVLTVTGKKQLYNEHLYYRLFCIIVQILFKTLPCLDRDLKSALVPTLIPSVFTQKLVLHRSEERQMHLLLVGAMIRMGISGARG